MEQKKYKWEVLSTMSWRDRDYEAGQIIEDTDNTYMRAMVFQEKLRKLED